LTRRAGGGRVRRRAGLALLRDSIGTQQTTDSQRQKKASHPRPALVIDHKLSLVLTG
jgi:hypothetical protein